MSDTTDFKTVNAVADASKQAKATARLYLPKIKIDSCAATASNDTFSLVLDRPITLSTVTTSDFHVESPVGTVKTVDTVSDNSDISGPVDVVVTTALTAGDSFLIRFTPSAAITTATGDGVNTELSCSGFVVA